MNAAVKEPVDRRKFLGGSDIAAVMGLSPWRTPVALWEEKSRPPAEDGDNRKVKRRGHRWESVVAEMLTEELIELGHTVEIVSANQRYIDPKHDFFACEIDFELRLDGAQQITNCELKTVHPFKSREWGDSGSDELPVHYTAQAMWGLGITGRSMCIVAPLFGADEIRVFPVLADPETINGMRRRGLHFWTQHVMMGVAPDPLQQSDVGLIFPKDSDAPAIEADGDLTSKILRMRTLDRQIKAATAELDHLEFDIKRVMRDTTEITVEGKSAITWKERKRTWLDQEALKSELPKIHRAYTRKDTARTFILKPFAWE